MNVLKIFIKHKIFIIFVALIFIIIYAGQFFAKINRTQTAVVSFVYPGYETGMYPDGTRFNMFDFISTEVLQKTIEKLNSKGIYRGVTPEELRSSIAIGVNLTRPVQERILEARKQGHQYAYFSNEYTIEYTQRNYSILGGGNKSNNGTFDFFLNNILPENYSRLFIETLLESYKEYFLDSYTEVGTISKINKIFDYSDYDYIEIADVIKAKTVMFINYLNSKKNEDGLFRSEVTGMSFDDLIAGFQSLQTNEINNLKAFVSTSKLSKNRTELINKFRSQIEKLQLMYNKKYSETDISLRAMRHYDHTFSENIVIPAIDEQNVLYQARPKTAYDIVTQRSLETGVMAQNYLKDIDELNRLIAEYEAVEISEVEYESLSIIADESITRIENEIERLVTLSNQTIDDYIMSNNGGYIRTKIADKGYINVWNIIKFFMASLFAFILACILALLKELINNKRNSKNKRIDDALERVLNISKGGQINV